MSTTEGVVVAVFPQSQAQELLMRCLNHSDADTPEFSAALETLADAIRDSIRESELLTLSTNDYEEVQLRAA
ncbi:MAG: hypothetical protein KF812_02095 [Fimbriimonadaceae bacterium]|nr:hypothetical protein [Fimbriimonadaceae bacterium]